jgi:hypothetical protein
MNYHKEILFFIGLTFSFMLGGDPFGGETSCMFKSSAERALDAGREETQKSFERCTQSALQLPPDQQEAAKIECRRVMNVFLDSMYVGRSQGDTVFIKR